MGEAPLTPASAPLWMAALGWESKGAGVAKHRRLYEALKAALLYGDIPAGTPWPSSRQLARALGLSRGTVLVALEQLAAEGYLEARRGSGTRVAADLHSLAQLPVRRAASRFGPAGPTAPAQPFAVGVPACDEGSSRLLARFAARAWQEPRPAAEALDPFGHDGLRRALCGYLYRARGVRAEPDQVMIANGAQHALYLAARALLRPGDVAWVENPGYQGARAAFQAAGARLVPVPVDRDGLFWTTSPAPEVPRLMHVTPSHQYPLGTTMSIGRRQALLAYAAQHGAYVVEDDYDSEFRFDGYPLPALQGLDPAERVIYVGTFSKVLAPAWRLGYAVLPRGLIRALHTLRSATDRGSPHVLQEAFAPFIAEGHLERHVARWRRRYRARRDQLAAALADIPGSVLDPAPAGLHLVLGLPDATDDRAVAQAAGRAGVVAEALSAYYVQPPMRRGLVLGYAAFEPAVLAAAADRLAPVLAAATQHA